MPNPYLNSLSSFVIFQAMFFVLRYLVFAGGAYFLFWIILGKSNFYKRIQKRPLAAGAVTRELVWSASTIIIFSAVGVLTYYLQSWGVGRIYDSITEYGSRYYLFSVVFALLLHDAYFYFVHRLLHTRYLFRKIHYVHHQSTNPTPLATYSFHPVEAILEALIVPLLAVVLPMHWSALFIFLVVNFLANVQGHLGFEFAKSGSTRRGLSQWFGSSTHHSLHHESVHYNFGLYLSVWDKIFSTLHPEYEERFEEVASAPTPSTSAESQT